MAKPGDVISYHEMCSIEARGLQAGMHFRPNRRYSILLMSQRPGAPYPDRINEDGSLFYIGHDAYGHPDKARIDQPLVRENGTLTENGKFFRAASPGRLSPEYVRVYEKVRDGVWVYNGVFELVGARMVPLGGRLVCEFKLLQSDVDFEPSGEYVSTSPGRLIPSETKRKVWDRDRGKCVQCGSDKNLHFDHIIPWSKGGSSSNPENIQLLCGKHNLEKRDRIE